MTPLVSFVVPCYNYGRYLRDCISSILAQEGGDIEIIAIDDASSDDTSEILRSFANPRLRIFQHAANEGHVATVNEGFALARGTFIARIDPDDRYRPCFLSTLLAKLAEHPNVGFAYGDAAMIDESGRITAEGCDHVHEGRDFIGNEFVGLLRENFICAPTGLGRREAWATALPIPEGLAFNDWYFNLMLARRYDFAYVQQVVAEYRVHSANHHARVVRDRTEEGSVFRLLDRIYAEREADPALQRAKMHARRQVYATQYLTLARKYFGHGMDEEARRCYLRALAYDVRVVAHAQPLRHFAATVMGRDTYEFCKKLMTLRR